MNLRNKKLLTKAGNYREWLHPIQRNGQSVIFMQATLNNCLWQTAFMIKETVSTIHIMVFLKDVCSDVKVGNCVSFSVYQKETSPQSA